MNKLLETTTTFPQTEIWNDSCSYEELVYAIENGATGATTNPVIVVNVLKKEISQWENTILQLIKEHPSASEDDIAWLLIQRLGSHASKLLLPLFTQSKGKKGRISFQTNAKFYRSKQKMVEHGIELANIVCNSQIKAPTSKAGVEAFEELTYQGISVNATVSFTCSQAIAVAEAVERGLARREAEGLPIEEMNPVCTIMVGRLDDYLKKVVKQGDVLIAEEALNYAGIATFKHTYSLYKQRHYRTKLLVAAFRNDQHWESFIGGNVVLTITSDWQRKYNESDRTIQNNMDTPIPETILKELYKLPEFIKAYEEDGLSLEEFEHYGAFLDTMQQFLSGYDELIHIIRRYMLK